MADNNYVKMLGSIAIS